ncbi:MAG: molybdopterin-dependent oxidoreductase [Deltaproteobacteria bacterium]|nr:molybdopterin-dependent oxidoreductase [Deltaproteobacteria bacterium]
MPTRRAFLGTLAAAACAPEGRPGDSAAGNADDPETLPPITPNDEFYTVAISAWQPDEAWLAAWSLRLTTPEGGDHALSLDALRAMPTTEQERTISCIGSTTGRFTGNAIWTVLSLGDLLDSVGIVTNAKYIRFTSGDGYTTTLPMRDLDEGLSLALAMNGEDLPAGHGAPVRALVPGRYGMKNPKWIERIDLVEEWEAGTWEARGWSDSAAYQVASWFIKPDAYATVAPEGGYIHGIAFAGEAGISKVELSDDQGKTWFEAEIVYPGGAGVWTIWRAVWVPPAAGEYTLVVRATAADGRVQAYTEVYDADLDGFEGFDQRTFVAT